MDFREMECFITIVREGNLSKASDKLFLTVPALSRMINKIESRLDTKLFNKEIYPWRLTYIGELYLEKSINILEMENLFHKTINSIKNNNKGKIKLALLEFEETYFLPKILNLVNKKIIEQNINIKLEIVNKDSSNIEKSILNREVDFGIIVSKQQNKNIQFEYLKQYEILVGVNLSHPIAKDYKHPKDNFNFPYINLELLKDTYFLLISEKFLLRQQIRKLCNNAGFSPKIKLVFDKMESAYSFLNNAPNENQAGFFFNALIEQNYNKNNLAFFKIRTNKEVSPSQTIGIGFIKSKNLSVIERFFIDILKEYSKILLLTLIIL